MGAEEKQLLQVERVGRGSAAQKRKRTQHKMFAISGCSTLRLFAVNRRPVARPGRCIDRCFTASIDAGQQRQVSASGSFVSSRKKNNNSKNKRWRADIITVEGMVSPGAVCRSSSRTVTSVRVKASSDDGDSIVRGMTNGTPRVLRMLFGFFLFFPSLHASSAPPQPSAAVHK